MSPSRSHTPDCPVYSPNLSHCNSEATRLESLNSIAHERLPSTILPILNGMLYFGKIQALPYRVSPVDHHKLYPLLPRRHCDED